MLDKNLLVTRIEQIDKHLERISLFSELSYEEFLNDINTQDIVEYNLFQIINPVRKFGRSFKFMPKVIAFFNPA